MEIHNVLKNIYYLIFIQLIGLFYVKKADNTDFLRKRINNRKNNSLAIM